MNEVDKTETTTHIDRVTRSPHHQLNIDTVTQQRKTISIEIIHRTVGRTQLLYTKTKTHHYTLQLPGLTAHISSYVGFMTAS